jgi:hypothetical protein
VADRVPLVQDLRGRLSKQVHAQRQQPVRASVTKSMACQAP